MILAPTILLIRPQMGENIGATARAMANFGVRELRLVAPRDGWPNGKAADVAGKALPIIDDARLFETTRDALADCQFVLATTARPRDMNIPAMDVRDAMAELRKREALGQRCAVLFGPERTGLENEDMVLADAVVSIPVAPEYASLNISQAAVVVLYEWFVSDQTANPPQNLEPVATRDELNGMLDQLEDSLDAADFWRVPAKKEVMWRNIRAGLVRAVLTTQEIATWRGMIKALREKRALK